MVDDVRDPVPTSTGTFVVLVALGAPALVGVLVAIPGLAGYAAAAAGISALVLSMVLVQNRPGATPPRLARRTRLWWMAAFLVLAAADALSARHVDGVQRVGLGVAVFSLVFLGLLVRNEPPSP